MTGHDVPIHFFTIVLNGQPFIRYHIDVFRTLPFRWHWHVVEGVAALRHDTAWSLAAGGRIDGTLHSNGLSNDGTSQYLDRIAGEFPYSVTLYRKPPGAFWDGKREMVAAPLANVNEPCLLWEVDADELWRAEQILAMRRLFQMHPGRTAAFYWCDYFVGPALVITTRYNYAQNPAVEWLRTWRYAPGMQWFAHEPPTLVARDSSGRFVNVAGIAPFTHDETEAVGARFQHFSYATEEQLRFKEIYYAEGNAEKWRRMNGEVQRAKFLRDYFPWVKDFTMIDRAARASVVPWAEPQEGGDWRFLSDEEIARHKRERNLPSPRILVDCTLSPQAPAKVNEAWMALLREWARTGFFDHVVLLDRGGMTPRFEGICYRSIPPASADERDLLQRVCDELDATLLLTSRSSAARLTPAVLLHGLDPSPAQIMTGPNISVHLVFSEHEREILIRAHPDIDPARVIAVGIGRDASGRGVPSVEDALRKIAPRP